MSEGKIKTNTTYDFTHTYSIRIKSRAGTELNKIKALFSAPMWGEDLEVQWMMVKRDCYFDVRVITYLKSCETISLEFMMSCKNLN